MGLHKGFLAVAVVGGILSLSAPCHAEGVQALLSAKKAEQAALNKKAKGLDSEVSGLKSELVSASKELRKSEEGLSRAEDRLADLREKKAMRVEKLYAEEDALGGLVMAAQRFNRTSTPQMLIRATPVEAARASQVMKSLIPLLDERATALRDELAALEELERDIKEQLEQKTKEINKINEKQKELEVLVQKRTDIYRQTENARKAQEKEVARLAKESRDLEDLVSKIQRKPERSAGQAETASAAPSSYRLPADMLPPVHGAIRTGFGETDDLGGKSKGITFTARPGAPVMTPLAGKVKFAGPFQKFRQILIIEHRGGYHSLIAGLDRIDTVVGASLAAGEPIGAAGTSGPEAQVYYELRHKGAPVNPKKLTLAQRKQEKS